MLSHKGRCADEQEGSLEMKREDIPQALQGLFDEMIETWNRYMEVQDEFFKAYHEYNGETVTAEDLSAEEKEELDALMKKFREEEYRPLLRKFVARHEEREKGD